MVEIPQKELDKMQIKLETADKTVAKKEEQIESLLK